jgi:glucose-6-phosphate 1-epimerase
MKPPALQIQSPAGTAELYPQFGGHLAAWQPTGQKPVLWLSAKSHFESGKAIRGGVPIIFPWFGPRAGRPDSPAHGFARSMPWTVHRDIKDGIRMELLSNDATRAHWPFDFALEFTVQLAAELTMQFKVTNTGKEPFKFEEALHTYFSVADVRNISITGLAGVEFIDKVDAFQRKVQGNEPIVITGETDRVYLKTKSTCVVSDPVLARKITVAKENSDATVVWNPWIAKAKAMSDFGDDEWPGMVCVETCNVGDFAISLSPTQSHTMTARLGIQ